MLPKPCIDAKFRVYATGLRDPRDPRQLLRSRGSEHLNLSEIIT
ncbi:hypothetical protein GXM_04019 [Nostoc sphaeroides CCNUC1]|uniref:Uncharacterized protein n=1 Tax=Nostoc sphaeroides CCNUC1 TaxID=2653204 RepID=A0A5P8W1D9_9NOSO|nr:hypothetical protein GXM_04019 [Nostoc sphaeroides CCNUC1]